VTIDNRGQQRGEHTFKHPRNAEVDCKTASARLAADFLSDSDSVESPLLNIENLFSSDFQDYFRHENIN